MSNTHISMAKFRQEGVHEWQSQEGDTDATNIAAVLDAQTEATLAVAYEQRTANLIALYSMDDGPVRGMVSNGGMNAENWDDVAKQIVERLGLA